MSLRLLIFWAIIMSGIVAVSGLAAAIWFAVGWLGATVLSLWEIGLTLEKGDK
jgi:hypothetical protein